MIPPSTLQDGGHERAMKENIKAISTNILPIIRKINNKQNEIKTTNKKITDSSNIF